MPKTRAEELIDLAKNTTLTDQELAQFKSNFKIVADSHATNQLRNNSADRSFVHEAINALVYERGGLLSQKKQYNLLETALLSKNEQVSNYLIEQFEQSYKYPPKDLADIYKGMPKVPPFLPIDRNKFKGADLAYVTVKDGVFENTYVVQRVQEKNARNGSEQGASLAVVTSRESIPQNGLDTANKNAQDLAVSQDERAVLPPPQLLTSRESIPQNVLDNATEIAQPIVENQNNVRRVPPPPPRVKAPGDEGVGGPGNSI